jgi:putative Mg2+ transporter-C (MgtC) family protein
MMPEIVFWQAMLDVLVAIICGGAIGLERQLRGKPAGLRTCIIVVLTTALFVTLGVSATESAGDPSRVVTGIVTGVGFLGAGVIFSQGGRVQGITTASLIWTLAAIGVTIGFGYPITAMTTTALIMGILTLIDLAERRFPRLRRKVDDDKDQGRDHNKSEQHRKEAVDGIA